MKYDGIILGSGHNSLILQAYLCRSGLKVLCIERNPEAGGALRTIEDPRESGFCHNTHSFFHRAIMQMPWYRDLELARHGAQYIEPELSTVLLLKDGRALEWWTDVDRTYESFAAFNDRDANTMRRWTEAFTDIVEKITGPESQAPPLPTGIRKQLLGASAMGRLLHETSQLSPLEFVEREFEDPVIKGGLLFFNGLREVDLRCRGFGHHIPMLLASRGKAQMCLGGAAALAKALVKVIEANNGEVLLNTSPKQVLVEHGRAVGVETENGECYFAEHFVASGLNPVQTFLELVPEASVPTDWRDKARNFHFNLIAPLMAVNLNLDEAPRYAAFEQRPHLQGAHMTILGLEGFHLYPEIVSHHEAGTIPPTVMWGCCPTLFDPSQAPAGKHTAFMWEKLPYRLHGDAANWDEFRDKHAQHMISMWSEYAPNLKDNIRSWFSRSPLDTERTFANMKFGDLSVGAFTHGQIGYDRPFPGAGHYRSCIDRLYLCAACCHPGGNITGLPGYNCAQVLMQDLSLPVPWAPVPIEQQLAALAAEGGELEV